MKRYLILLLFIISHNVFCQNTSEQSQEDLAIDYSIIEVKPEYPGGMKNFYSFIAKNFSSPEQENLKGKIIIDYIIEKDGTLSNMKIKEDVGYDSGKEAIRVLNLMSKWKPGEHNGKIVRTLYFLKINVETVN